MLQSIALPLSYTGALESILELLQVGLLYRKLWGFQPYGVYGLALSDRFE